MNIKAAYYAFSRMLLPTITVIGLILLSTLSIEITFGFLMQKTWLSGLLRVALLAVELIWFYYLYVKKSGEIALEEGVKDLETGFKFYNNGRIDYIENLLIKSTSVSSNEIETVAYKKLTDKVFLIKLLK